MRISLTARCALGAYLGFAVTSAVLGQQPAAPAADPKAQLQQKLAAFKQSLAENKKALQQYSWIETTEISLKGEVKKREQKQCHYGPDGQVAKTPLAGAPAPAQQETSGGRGGRHRGGGAVKEKIVANKVDDMKEYMGQVAGLVKQYVPPEPAENPGLPESRKGLRESRYLPWRFRTGLLRLRGARRQINPRIQRGRKGD